MNVGGVAGGNVGTVKNCYSTGDVKGNQTVGGVVGSGTNSSTISNCYSEGKVTGSGDYTGGIAGQNSISSTIQNCYSKGDVEGGNRAGGIAGTNQSGGTINNCYSTSNVSGSGDNIGGIVGYNSETIQYCYSTGNVTGNTNVGGITGNNFYMTRNCVALNKEITGGTNVGRVAGREDTILTLHNNYARTGMNGITWTNNVHDKIDGAEVSATSHESIGTGGYSNQKDFWEDVMGWNFSTAGEWQWGSSLPILRNMPAGTQNPTVVP
jgi:hypothetical protein